MKIGQEVVTPGFEPGKIVNATFFDSEGNVEGYVLVDLDIIHDLEWHPVSEVRPRYEDRQVYIEEAIELYYGLKVKVRHDRYLRNFTIYGPLARCGNPMEITLSL